MEQREHPRIRVPIAVELTHPSLGTVHTSLRDASAGGVFVYLPQPSIGKGARVKLKATTLIASDPQPTPTVDMQVVRVCEDGLGLTFANKTAEHLWHSVRHWRSELAVGEDYFQVHQSVLLHHPKQGVLLVQRHGKWLLPGHYLSVGSRAIEALASHVADAVNARIDGEPVCVHAGHSPTPGIPEAATYLTVFSATIEQPPRTLPSDSPYRQLGWVANLRELSETTFADATHMALVERYLQSQEEAAD